MEGKKLAKFLLLLMVLDLLMISATEAKPWLSRRRRRRRRRRRSVPQCNSSLPGGVHWVNHWQRYLIYSCLQGYVLNHWRSQHRNCKEDRVHHFRCRKSPISYHGGNCAWTNHFVNDFDQPVNFKCSHNGLITGIRSEYSGHHKDRRFGFRCCHLHGYIYGNCQMTPYLNSWDQSVNYWVPSGYYLVGVHSYHHNHYEDRRWRFEICQMFKYTGK